MNSMPGLARRNSWSTLAAAALFALATLIATPFIARAQGGGNTGSVTGRVVDEAGAPVASVQVFVDRTTLGTITHDDGTYALIQVPEGTHLLRTRLIGFRPESATVTVVAGQPVTHDFTIRRDPLQLQAIVVTGTSAPTANLKSSVAITTLTPQEIQQSQPRSTTEMLRYVPGFTRVESSGGEVNENIEHARHPRRRVRDVHGGWAAGVSDHAHVLHERGQSVPPR